MTISPCPLDKPIPKDATCQEASAGFPNMYMPCGSPAVAIVYHDRDRRGYYMCLPCADHNIRNRDGKLLKVNSAGRVLVGRAQKVGRDYRHKPVEGGS